MYIRSVRISGFGHFQQLEIDDIPPGLTILEGANEAGKTTLLAFIRAILFGFADRRSSSPRYEPQYGGNHGGSLVLVDETGETYRIERKPGSARGEVTIYLSDTIQRGEAGVKNLLKGMSEHLFQQIFCFGLDELQRLENLDSAEVSGLIYSAGMGYTTRSYPQIHKSLTEAQGNLYKLSGRKPELNRLLGELSSLDEQIHIAEQASDEYNLLKKALHELTQTVQSLETAQQACEAKESSLKTLQRVSQPFRQLKQIEAELRRLPLIDSFPEDGVQRLEGCRAKRQEVENAYERLLLDLAGYERELAERKIHEALLTAGSQIQELYAGVRLFQERLKEREQLEIQVSQRYLEVKHCLSELGAGWNPERVQYFPITLLRRERVRDFISRQKALEIEHRALEQEYRSAILWKEEREQECSLKEYELNRLKSTGGARKTGQKVLYWTLGLSAVLITGAGWFLAGASWLPGIILALTALALLGAGSYLSRLVSKTGDEQLQAVEVELHERRAARGRAESQCVELERRIRSHDEDKTRFNREWRSFLVQDQLSEELRPEDVLDLFKMVEQGQEILRRYDEVLANRDQIVAEIKEFAHKTNQVLSSLGRPEINSTGAALVIYQMHDELEQEKEAQKRAVMLQEQCRELLRERTVLEHQQERLTSEYTQLLSEGQVCSEEDFRAKSQIYQQRQALYRTKLEWETAFATSAAANVEELKEILEGTGEVQLAEELSRIQSEKDQLKSRLDEHRQNQGRFQARLDQLAASTELSTIRQLRANIMAEITLRAEEWMVLRLSQSLLEKAKDRYEQERQPEVLQKASELFSELTGGRYKRVLRSLEANRLEVERADGRRLDTTGLSRGTAEQLYLAMRFALVKEFSSKSLPLPMIMDDILVNFDAERTGQALRVMAKFAQDNQILFFTCHSHLIPLLQQAGIRYNHFHLSQSGLKRF